MGVWHRGAWSLSACWRCDVTIFGKGAEGFPQRQSVPVHMGMSLERAKQARKAHRGQGGLAHFGGFAHGVGLVRTTRKGGVGEGDGGGGGGHERGARRGGLARTHGGLCLVRRGAQLRRNTCCRCMRGVWHVNEFRQGASFTHSVQYPCSFQKLTH